MIASGSVMKSHTMSQRSILWLAVLSSASGLCCLAIPAKAQLGPGKVSREIQSKCFTITPLDTIHFGKVLIGASFDTTFDIRNTFGAILRIHVGSPDTDTEFNVPSLQSTLVLPGSKDSVLHASYQPSRPGQALRHFSFAPDSTTCDTERLLLEGTGLTPLGNRSTISLFSSSRSFGFLSSNTSITDTFFFKNDQVDTLHIDSARFTLGSHFSVGAPQLPLRLLKGDSIRLTLTFTARAGGGQEKDELIIATSDIVASEAYTVYGGQMLAFRSVARTKLPEFSIDLMPNPTRGEVTVNTKGLQRAHVQVIDILGRVLITSPMADTWKWRGTDAAGHAAAMGVYIIRITGRGTNGAEVTSSKRLVLIH